MFYLLQVNGQDVRGAAADEAVRAISQATKPIVVEVLRRQPPVSVRRLPPPPPTTSGVDVMEVDEAGSLQTDCVPPAPAAMITTATQTDDCALDDDYNEVDFVDQLDCQHYAVYDYA